MIIGSIFVGLAVGIAGILVTASVCAWGAVQLLNAMDILDARRDKKIRKLVEARRYLKDPEKYKSSSNVTWTNPGTNANNLTITNSTFTATDTQPVIRIENT